VHQNQLLRASFATRLLWIIALAGLSCCVKVEIHPQPSSYKSDFSQIVFLSNQALVPEDTNKKSDVYVLETASKRMYRLVPPQPTDPTIESYRSYARSSTNGRFVLFSEVRISASLPKGGASSVWLYDFETEQHQLVSTNSSGAPAEYLSENSSLPGGVSDDGRHIAFQSFATNLIPNDTNAGLDIFYKNLGSGNTMRLSQDTAGNGGFNPEQKEGAFSISPIVSASGQFAAFSANAINLVPGITNRVWDVFVADLQKGGLKRVSTTHLANAEVKSHAVNPDISSDGRHVVFSTISDHYQDFDYKAWNSPPLTCPNAGPNTVVDGVHGLCGSGQIVMKDTQTSAVERISMDFNNQPAYCGLSRFPRISPDAEARYVVFQSKSKTLAGEKPAPHQCFSRHPADRIFLRDRETQTTKLLSIDENGRRLKGPCILPWFSPRGLEVAFYCESPLFADEPTPKPGTPRSWVVFVKNLETGTLWKPELHSN